MVKVTTSLGRTCPLRDVMMATFALTCRRGLARQPCSGTRVVAFFGDIPDLHILEPTSGDNCSVSPECVTPVFLLQSRGTFSSRS